MPGVELQVHSFFPLDGGDWSNSCPGCFDPRKTDLGTRRLSRPQILSGYCGTEIRILSLREWNSESSIVQPVAELVYRLR